MPAPTPAPEKMGASGTALSTVSVLGGAAVPAVASAAAAQSAVGGAYYLSGDHAVLHLVGAADVRVE